MNRLARLTLSAASRVLAVTAGLCLLPAHAGPVSSPTRLAVAGQGNATATSSRPSPARIISLAPAFTEATCMLGACSRLVGTDRFSDWPAEVKTLPKLGSLDEVSVEAVARLRPDLILSMPGGRLNARLRALGLQVLEMRSDSMQDIQLMLQKLEASLGDGALPSGVPMPHARALWDKAQRDIAAIAQALPAQAGRRVYIEVDPALYAAGPDSWLGQLLAQLGARNIVPPGLGAFPKMAPEFVLTQQPEVIMQMHEGPGPDARPGWQALMAKKHPVLCKWTAAQTNILVRPGPRLAEAAALMASCLGRAK